VTEEPDKTPQAQADTPMLVQPILASEMATHRSPDFRTIYANNTKFGASPFEFSLIFGEIGENVEGQIYIDQKVRVLLAPVHAKLFLIVLAQNVASFEAQFGEIKIPERLFGMAQTVATPEPPKAGAKQVP
jgi:hypothetical protein